jgi:type IV pilus assembly protein PilN
MIRINLLSEKKKIKGPVNFVIQIVIVTVATLLVAALATVLLKQKVSQLRAEIETNNATIADLTKKINEVKKYEQYNKKIEQKSAIIETLRKRQSVPVKILNDISMTLPNGVWLSALIYKDEGVDLEGYAFTNFNIVNYVENLKKLDNLTDVYLVESRESEIEQKKAYKFKIIFKVRV